MMTLPLKTRTKKKDRYKPVPCCLALKRQLTADVMLTYLERKPFSKRAGRPNVYMISDGGHGGATAINFCPFCGKQLTFMLNVSKQVAKLMKEMEQ